MNTAPENQFPKFRDAVTFWKDQFTKVMQRNLALNAELDEAENQGVKWMLIATVFAVLFFTALGFILL